MWTRPSLPVISTLVLALFLFGLWPGSARADDFEREPIRYSASTPSNVVSRLEQRISGGVRDELEEEWR